MVGKPLHRSGVPDVDVLRTVGGIESDAEGVVQAAGEGGDLGGLAIGTDAAQDDDLAGPGVGEEKVAIGRGHDQARHREGATTAGHVLDVVGALHGSRVAARVERHLEAGRRDR